MEKSTLKIKELEYKYKAEDISLSNFRSLMGLVHSNIGGSITSKDTSSWDHYFSLRGINSDDIMRLRDSDTPELTRKRKINKGNSWDRIEIDIPLDPKRYNKEEVFRFLEESDYIENFNKIHESHIED